MMEFSKLGDQVGKQVDVTKLDLPWLGKNLL